MRNKYCLALIVLLLSACNNPAETELPNIIIILADDLGTNDISCYRADHPGYSEKPPSCETPTIDQLAAEGMRFTTFYCGAAVCSPSRAALQTGRNTTRLGVYNWIPGNCPMHLREEEITIAELLKEKHYRTGHFGKWHLTSEHMKSQPLPEDQGYDYAFYTYNNAHPSHQDPVNFIRHNSPVGPMKGYACQLVMDEALGWLDTVRQQTKPFFMNICFNEPHDKVAAPDSLTEKHSYNKEYYGCIENMDYSIGRLHNYLTSNDLAENTIIIFCSDNGSQVHGSNDPLRGDKAFNFEGGIRSPFIIRWPEMIEAGSVSNFPGSFTDIFPSLASIADIPMPDDRKYDGIDISKVFLDPHTQTVREDTLFFYRYFHDPICMLRDGDWILLGFEETMPYAQHYPVWESALIKPEEGKPNWSQWGFQEKHMEYIEQQKINHFKLYNIAVDPEQKNDLSTAHSQKVSEMSTALLRLRDEMISEGGNWYKNNSTGL